MTPPLVKRLVLVAVLGTSAAMLLMLAGVLYPSPFLLVLVMSVGQGVGILSLALFLLAVTLDLQGAISAAGYDYLPESGEGDHPPESEDDAASGLKPGA
jgi:Zn-dependent membrane protease YugP